MTALGKILVFVNLVFSVLTAGLIILVFVTRTNWKARTDEAVNEIKVARAEVSTERESSKNKVDAVADQLKRIQADLATIKGERDQLKNELAQEKSQHDQLRVASDAAKVNTGLQQKEQDRLKEERQNMMTQIAKRDTELIKLRSDITVFRDRAVSADISAASAQTRNAALLEQLETANRQLSTVKASGGAASLTALNRPAPPEDVRGRVLELDEAHNLARISIGTDVGVTKGTVLQIYRLTPNSVYLGEMTIVDAAPKSAVGRYTMAPSQKRTPLKAGPTDGDEVASQISHGR